MREYSLSVLLAIAAFISGCSLQKKMMVTTVQGEVKAADLGKTLVHEHVTTDFIGAEKVQQPQYETDFAVQKILPYFRQLKEKGGSTLVECTPNYIGRDVRLLKKLSELSGINIITNTGYYAAVDKKYLPRHAYEEDAETISARWEKEWEKGIDGTGIKPGFIKLGVGKGPLDSLEEKLLRAGILLSKKSGLPIYVHTGDGAAAQSEYEIIQREDLPADHLIWVHAQNGTDEERINLAQKDVWISLDGVSVPRVQEYVEMIAVMKTNGLLSKLLISHDDGWSVENKEGQIALTLFGNGNAQPYSTILDQLFPKLLEVGFTQKELDQLLIDNPQRALAIRAPTQKKIINTGGRSHSRF